MSERTFPSGDWAVDDAEATTRIADLAELVLDEISRPNHDWPALGRQAEALYAMAAAMAELYPAGGGGRVGGAR